MAVAPQVSPHIGAKIDMDRLIAGLAGRQHGVVSRAQLLELGIGPRAIGLRLERGRLHRVHRGVYAAGHRTLSLAGHAMAAVLLGGPDAALSHRAAGEHLGLCPGDRSAFDVTVPRRCSNRTHIRFHCSDLPPDEVTTLDGIPVTTVPRTLLDLAAVLDSHRLERALNEAEIRRLTDPLSLEDMLARHPRRHGAVNLRAILAAGRLGEGVTREELEARFLAFLDRNGIPRPRLNVPLRLGNDWIEVDCLWREQRLIVELDGRDTHGTRAAFERDRVRDRRLQAAGWRVIRVTWRELHREPRRLAADLRALLAASPEAGYAGPIPTQEEKCRAHSASTRRPSRRRPSRFRTRSS